MVDEGWVKLYRKSLESEVFNDQNAWRVFTWLLLKVDKNTGKKIIGRFWASKELGLNSNTFYKALGRLEKKHKMVTLSVTTKNTEVSLINWKKYQNGNSDDNSLVTTGEQHGNTLQEISNIESKKSAMNSLMPMTREEIFQAAKACQVSLGVIFRKHEQILNMLKDGTFQRKYRNHKTMYRTLIKWVQMDIAKGQTETWNEFEAITFKDYDPKLPENKEMFDNYEKRLKEFFL